MKKIIIFSLIILCISGKVYATSDNDEQRVRYIYPMKGENIDVIRQDISYEIDTVEPTTAYVTTDYLLKNSSDSVQKMMLVIPYLRENDDLIEVLLDDTNVEKQIIHIKGIHFKDETWSVDNTNSLKYEQVVDRIDEAIENLSNINPLQSIGIGTRTILFMLELQPQETHVLQVSYKEYPILQKDPWSEKWTPKFTYYLKSSAYWKDIKEINITINVPDNYIITEYSLPKIDTEDSGTYKGTYNVLPMDNISFLVKEKIQSIKFNFGQYKSRDFMTFLGAFVGIVSMTLLIVLIIDHKNW